MIVHNRCTHSPQVEFGELVVSAYADAPGTLEALDSLIGALNTVRDGIAADTLEKAKVAK